MNEQATASTPLPRPSAPLLDLLNPREQTWTVIVLLALGLVLGSLEIWLLGWPLWDATVTVLLLLLIPGVLKWRADLRRSKTVTVAPQSGQPKSHISRLPNTRP